MFWLLRSLHQVRYNYMHSSSRSLSIYMMVAGCTVLPATIMYTESEGMNLRVDSL